jgi:hypothetical protein
MTNAEKIETLKECFEEVIWMSIRYAHGRQTVAPTMVRRAIKMFQEVFPDWVPKEDNSIEAPAPKENAIRMFKDDYLHDLVNR